MTYRRPGLRRRANPNLLLLGYKGLMERLRAVADGHEEAAPRSQDEEDPQAARVRGCGEEMFVACETLLIAAASQAALELHMRIHVHPTNA